MILEIFLKDLTNNFPRTEKYKYSIFMNDAMLWNELIGDIEELDTVVLIMPLPKQNGLYNVSEVKQT